MQSTFLIHSRRVVLASAQLVGLHDALALKFNAAQLFVEHVQLPCHSASALLRQAALDSTASPVDQPAFSTITDLALELQELLEMVTLHSILAQLALLTLLLPGQAYGVHRNQIRACFPPVPELSLSPCLGMREQFMFRALFKAAFHATVLLQNGRGTCCCICTCWGILMSFRLQIKNRHNPLMPVLTSRVGAKELLANMVTLTRFTQPAVWIIPSFFCSSKISIFSSSRKSWWSSSSQLPSI